MFFCGFFKNIYLLFILFILAVPGLSCGGMAGSSSWHVGFLVAACMWDLVLRPGIKPRPPVLGSRSLPHWTTREVPRMFFNKFPRRPPFSALPPNLGAGTTLREEGTERSTHCAPRCAGQRVL